MVNMKKILILMLLSSSLLAQKFQTVTRIVDGDTYILSSGLRVRLINVNTPEKKNALCSLEQPYAQIAKDSVSNLILNQIVQVTKYKKDVWGRTIVSLKIRKKSLSRIIVQKGWGWYMPYKKSSKFFLAYENEAKSKKLGLWALENPINPTIWRKKYSTHK